jgi:hypothetical protein
MDASDSDWSSQGRNGWKIFRLDDLNTRLPIRSFEDVISEFRSVKALWNRREILGICDLDFPAGRKYLEWVKSSFDLLGIFWIG